MRLLLYLFSLLVHVVAYGLGRRHSLSSIPFFGRKSIPIKPLPGWLIMVALWVLRKIWNKFGGRVTAKAQEHVSKYQGPGAQTAKNLSHRFDAVTPNTVTVEPSSNQSKADGNDDGANLT